MTLHKSLSFINNWIYRIDFMADVYVYLNRLTICYEKIIGDFL